MLTDDRSYLQPNQLPLAHRLTRSFQNRADWHSHRWLKMLRYGLFFLRAPRAQIQWLATLESRAAFRIAVLRDMSLHERWQHRWINLRLWPGERLQILLGHYQCLADLLPTISLDRLYTHGDLSVASSSLKDQSSIEVLLMPPIIRSHEGELDVVIRSADGERLYSMTVTFDPARSRLLIGCLQGPRGEQGLAKVRAVTKLCHGLRPKNLLLSMAFVLAKAAGLASVEGISNHNHAQRKGGRIRASYDEFWIECGGVLGRHGFFHLGGAEPTRDERQVASKHRASFRQRESLRRELVDQFSRVLEAR